MPTIREALAKLRQTDNSYQLPDAKFGSGDRGPCEWRNIPDLDSLIDNDELPAVIPQSTIDLIGFDPRELDDDDIG